MFITISEESRPFMELAAKALRGVLTPDEQARFNQLLKQHPELKQQFADLQNEIEESRLNELWERGLRVIFRCPQPEDRPFLESVKKSNPKAWLSFLEGLFVLRVMAESKKNKAVPTFSNELSENQKTKLLAAIKAANVNRKPRSSHPPAK